MQNKKELFVGGGGVFKVSEMMDSDGNFVCLKITRSFIGGCIIP